MGFIVEWMRRLRHLIFRRRHDHELQEEMNAHREMMGEPSRFGNTLRLREDAREVWGWSWLDHALQDFRLALRMIHKNPGYSLTVILTLALGIGVNTAVFSLLDGFDLRALPYPHPERVASLVVHREGTDPGNRQTMSEEDDSFDSASWLLFQQSVSGVRFAAWGGSGGINLNAGAEAGGAVRYVDGWRVSASYFDVLGVPIYLGRSFNSDEDRAGGPPAVVLSYPLWMSAFHSNPDVVGKSVELKGEPYTVVGVLGRDAIVPSKAELFTPLQPADGKECLGGDNCGILIRLAPGTEWPQVHAQLSRLRLKYFDELETQYHGHAFVYARPLQLELSGNMHDRIEVLMLAVGFILLIACANLAGLMLVRVLRRTPEIATRLALGGSRFDVLRQLWIENLTLALAGAAAGVGLATFILSALRGLLPSEMIPVGGIAVDGRALVFAAAVAILTSLLFGALPALQARRIDLRASMSEGSRSVARGSVRSRQILIGGEVALTLVLLAAAGLFVRTLIHFETLPNGFDSHNVLTANVSLDDARYHDAAAFRNLLDKSLAAMKRIPGVADAAVGLSVPYERGLNSGFTVVDGPQAGAQPGSSMAYVTPGYFSTLRIPLLAGRDFSDADTANSEPVAIVNRRFAKQFFNADDAIGRHIRANDIVYRIVGIAQNVAKRPGFGSTAPIDKTPVFYLPAAQTAQGLINVAHIWFEPSWIVRTNGPVNGLTEAMQRALADADPNLPFAGFRSMDQILNEQLQLQRVEVALLSTLAGLALILSAVGIYGLVSNLVVQRRREIGIRIALGSSVRQSIVEVATSGCIAAGIGLVAGVGLSFAVLRILAGEIYGVTAFDPATLGATVLILAFTAVAASAIPSLRIALIQPSETLRSE